MKTKQAPTKHSIFNLNTKQMLGYHRPKRQKQTFIIEHVATLAITIVSANSIKEAITIFTDANHIPVNHIRVFTL